MMTPFMVGELSDIVVAASCAAILKRRLGLNRSRSGRLGGCWW